MENNIINLPVNFNQELFDNIESNHNENNGITSANTNFNTNATNEHINSYNSNNILFNSDDKFSSYSYKSAPEFKIVKFKEVLNVSNQ